MIRSSEHASTPETGTDTPSSEQKQSTLSRWIKRFGVAGFLFFLIKGLLWLLVPTLIVWFGC